MVFADTFITICAIASGFVTCCDGSHPHNRQSRFNTTLSFVWAGTNSCVRERLTRIDSIVIVCITQFLYPNLFIVFKSYTTLLFSFYWLATHLCTCINHRRNILGSVTHFDILFNDWNPKGWWIFFEIGL